MLSRLALACKVPKASPRSSKSVTRLTPTKLNTQTRRSFMASKSAQNKGMSVCFDTISHLIQKLTPCFRVSPTFQTLKDPNMVNFCQRKSTLLSTSTCHRHARAISFHANSDACLSFPGRLLGLRTQRPPNSEYQKPFLKPVARPWPTSPSNNQAVLKAPHARRSPSRVLQEIAEGKKSPILNLKLTLYDINSGPETTDLHGPWF